MRHRCGAAAAGRLNALRNMLTTASDLLQAGDLAGACGQLQQAYRRTDSSPRPPDFVAGSSASVLAAMIQEVMDELGCT